MTFCPAEMLQFVQNETLDASTMHSFADLNSDLDADLLLALKAKSGVIAKLTAFQRHTTRPVCFTLKKIFASLLRIIRILKLPVTNS